MSDLISRQAAIDIVNGYAEQFNGYIGSPNDSEVYSYARGLLLSIERNINAVPSVKIVRCKDCVFSKPYNEKWIQPKMLNNDRWCELYGTRHQNWYCADGERKEE